MFRLINGVTVRGRIPPTPKHRSQSPSLISPPISRSIYVPPGFLTKPFKTHRKMAQVVPQTRPLSEVEPDRSGLLTSVEKKPRLEVGVERFEEQPVASTSTVAAEQKPVNGGKQSEKKGSKRKKRKHLLPEPYSQEDVLWRDVRDLLGADVVDGIIEEGREWESPFQFGEEVEVEVTAIASTGTHLHAYSLLYAL